MKRGMAWFPVQLEVLGSLEFRRLTAEQLGAWVRLVAISAARESGGRVPGARGWRPDDFATLIGKGADRGTLRALVAGGLAAWDGDDLVILHYPVDSEAKVVAKREAGTAAAAKRWEAEKLAAEVEAAESLRSSDAAPNAHPMQSKSKRESKKGGSVLSGSSLREAPDPGRGKADKGQQLGLLPDSIPPTPKAKAPPPWRRMLDAFARGAGERWTDTPVDRGLAIRLGGIATDLKASGVTAADLVRAGTYAARGRREQLTPSWCAMTGKLVEAIGRAKHAETSPIADAEGWTVIRGGRAASSSESDDRSLAAAADPPA